MQFTDEHADVVILTALEIERDALLGRLVDVTDVTQPGGPFQSLGRLVCVDRHQLSVVVATSLRVGMTDTAINATKLNQKWSPQIIAMTGILAGTSRDSQGFGDIVFSSECFDYGSGKWTEDGFHPDYRFLALDSTLGTLYYRISESDILDIYRSCSGMKRPKTVLKVHFGPTGSGAAVIARQDIIQFALKHNRKLQGIDMEAYAVFRAAAEAPEPRPLPLVIKSISDFADEQKTDEFHQYAASTSAKYLLLLLSWYIRPHAPRTKTGVRNFYLRQDMNNGQCHPPLSSAKRRICLMGGSLYKYVLSIRDMKPDPDLVFDIVLPDPENQVLLEEWMKVIPEDPQKYCKDVINTIENLKTRIQDLNINLRVSAKLHITTMCMIDDEVIIIEVNSYKCWGRDRLMVEVESHSHLGDQYRRAFDTLFRQGRPISSSNDYESLVSSWNDLMTPSISRSLQSLCRAKPFNHQFEGSKILLHEDKIQHWLAGDDFAPVTLELDPTLSCNDACPRCTYGFAHQGRSLSLDQIRCILDEASTIGILGLTVTGGGDPLQHPDPSGLFRIIRGYDFSSGIFTNGALIRSDEFAEKMLTSFNWIRVFLDAAPEARFKKVRDRSGFQQRLECISRLPSIRSKFRLKSELGVSFLTSTESSDEIPEAAKLVRDLGFDYVQFKPMIQWTSSNHHLSFALEQKKVFAHIQDSLQFENDSFRVLFSREKYESDVLELTRYYSKFHCAWFVVAVGPNVSGSEVKPTLYLDCSSKYIPQWTIGEFDSLSSMLSSVKRKEMIASTSSGVYCVASETRLWPFFR